MIQRIEFRPMPNVGSMASWNDVSLERGSVCRSFTPANEDSLLEVQVDAMKGAVEISRHTDKSRPQTTTLELSHQIYNKGQYTEILVLWRLVPYAASGFSPRGETAEVQTEVRTDG